jgi:hypothetical protein
LEGTNTLAYLSAKSVTKKKVLMKLRPSVHLSKYAQAKMYFNRTFYLELISCSVLEIGWLVRLSIKLDCSVKIGNLQTRSNLINFYMVVIYNVPYNLRHAVQPSRMFERKARSLPANVRLYSWFCP